jgi:hypothetical protein
MDGKKKADMREELCLEGRTKERSFMLMGFLWVLLTYLLGIFTYGYGTGQGWPGSRARLTR